MSQQQTQQQLDIDSANEVASMAQVEHQWDQIRKDHPDWYARYDELLLDSVASRSEMAELWVTAPTLWAAGVIYGKFTLRLEISAHTSIPFV